MVVKINAEKHLSLDAVWGFSNEYISHPVALLWEKYSRIIDEVLSRPRSGWRQRKIPAHIAETIGAHCAKVAIAADIYVRQGSNTHLKEQHKHIVLTAGLHDLPEWKAPDYTVSDIKRGVVTAQEKARAEQQSIQAFSAQYNDNLPEKLFVSLEQFPDLPQNQLIHNLDKLDAGVMALNYEALGYQVSDFFPYTAQKLTDPLLQEAFAWLLQKEFYDIDFFYQYCVFLFFQGDTTKVRQHLCR